MRASVYLKSISLAGMVSIAAACVVDATDHHGMGGMDEGAERAPGPAGASGSTAAPILVEVDTDKTMNEQSGQGVGIFVEYGAGGHWRVRWTCDTSVSQSGRATCDFAVRATAATGAIANVVPEGAGAVAQQSGPPEIVMQTTTGAEFHGFTFDTDPGAVLTVDATIGGQRDPQLFFFVQRGIVNGGVDTTQLTDPLSFVGTTP